MGKFSFGKKERLSSEKWIRELFEKGSSFYSHPFKVLFMLHPDEHSANTQVLVSVPSRNFPRAVDRNLLKRRVREVYRTNKACLSSSRKWLIAYIYTAREVLPLSVIRDKLPATLNRISDWKYEKG